MANTPVVMFRGAASVLEATLYTVPAGKKAVVTNVLVTNTNGADATFTLELNGVHFVSGATIAANATAVFDLRQVLAAGQTISGLASAITVNFHISGMEIG